MLLQLVEAHGECIIVICESYCLAHELTVS